MSGLYVGVFFSRKTPTSVRRGFLEKNPTSQQLGVRRGFLKKNRRRGFKKKTRRIRRGFLKKNPEEFSEKLLD